MKPGRRPERQRRAGWPASVEYIMATYPRLADHRYMHSTGASASSSWSICTHVPRPAVRFYRRPRELTGCSGAHLPLLMVKPSWATTCYRKGQMSLWGAG